MVSWHNLTCNSQPNPTYISALVRFGLVMFRPNISPDLTQPISTKSDLSGLVRLRTVQLGYSTKTDQTRPRGTGHVQTSLVIWRNPTEPDLTRPKGTRHIATSLVIWRNPTFLDLMGLVARRRWFLGYEKVK